MLRADKNDKSIVKEILSECFQNNKTVNWLVKQDNERLQRIEYLIDYSFETCLKSDLIFLSDERNGVIMCNMSDDKLPVLEEAFLTMQFVIKVTGIERITRMMQREEFLEENHPDDFEYIYIWYIGVKKDHQRKGVGTELVKAIIQQSNQSKTPILTETSNEETVQFLQKMGFQVYKIAGQALFGFNLFFSKKTLRDT